MERLVAEAVEALAEAPAEDVIRWATDTFGDRICITSSMSDAVVIHLASRVKPGIDVVFLDTGNVTASRTVAEQDAELGPRLHGRNPDLCCYLRKVVPLERALGPYDAWITGVRREETSARSDTQVVEWNERRQMVKVNPIVAWTQEQIEAYVAEHGVLVNPLVYDGYPSIGCAPCTARVEPGADPRSGRWTGTGKTECGIHL
jgi:phosphoadenosine phosphosulfate reductase